MDVYFHVGQASADVSRAIGIVLEAAQHAREARREKLSAKLEDLVEELLLARRELLELPPQRSTSLQDREEDTPF